jgi:transposase
MSNIEKSTLKEDNTTDNSLEFFEEKYSALQQENLSLKKEKEILEAKLKYYEEQLRLNQVQKYGASSEKSDSDQISFFNEAEKLSAQRSEEPEMETILVNRKKGKSKKRKTFDDLPIERIYYSIPEDEQICPNCNGHLHEMKVEVRKELKIIPAKVMVVHHEKQVYACRTCDVEEGLGTIITAPSKNAILPGSMVSPSLLAFIMDKKYNQAMPLYRQEKEFVNFGIDITRQNMANWIINGSERWLKYIYDRLHGKLLEEKIIHADETTLQVIDEKKNKKNYMWLYASAKSTSYPIRLFEYQPSRSNTHPKRFLKGFSGYLQTDGYAGYNSVEDVIQIGCFAHARRKYKDALKVLPKDADETKTEAYKAVKMISALYHYEDIYSKKGLNSEERYKERIEKSKPLLDEYYQWLIDMKTKALPKGKLGEAVNYSLNQWDKLSAFMQDGGIAIDNNLAERSIKDFVIGRKNWIFCKSPKGATASAVCYSIIGTAKANGLKPFQYLTYIFDTLPNIDIENIDELDALLPWSNSIPADCQVSK